MKDLYIPVEDIAWPKVIPILQPIKENGMWMWSDEDRCFKCSECEYHAFVFEVLDGQYKYCPNCGKPMKVEGEE